MFQRSLAVLLFLATPMLADVPRVSTTTSTEKMSVDECMTRVVSAFRAREFAEKNLSRTKDGWTAMNDHYSATLECTAGKDATLLSVIVAAGGIDPAPERDALLQAFHVGAPKPVVIPIAAGKGRVITWTDTFDKLENAKAAGPFDYICPPNGKLAHDVWGTFTYTNNSVVCLAAVHMGLITLKNGGPVTVARAPQQNFFPMTARNSVASHYLDKPADAFTFTSAPTSEADADRMPISFITTAADFRGRTGAKLLFSCPIKAATDAPVYGSGPYALDSSICMAAVHAGLFQKMAGGSVNVEIRGPEKSFTASEQNGVTTKERGAEDASFVFVP